MRKTAALLIFLLTICSVSLANNIPCDRMNIGVPIAYKYYDTEVIFWGEVEKIENGTKEHLEINTIKVLEGIKGVPSGTQEMVVYSYDRERTDFGGFFDLERHIVKMNKKFLIYGWVSPQHQLFADNECSRISEDDKAIEGELIKLREMREKNMTEQEWKQKFPHDFDNTFWGPSEE